MRPLALKWRLSLLVAAALAVSIGLICVAAYVETREVFYRQTDQSLLTLARAADDVSNDTDDLAAMSAKLAAVLPAPGKHADVVARVWREDTGQVIHVAPAAGIQWDAVLPSLSQPAAGHSRFTSLFFGKHDYRVVWLRPANEHISITIAQATGAIQTELRELYGEFVSIGVAAIVTMAALSILLVRVGLSPVRQAARHLRKVDARSLPLMDLQPSGVPGELSPFVDALAQMLHRLQDAMQRQKAFIADASHELRTPLTAAKSTVQTTLAAPRSADEYRQSLEETLEDLRRMEHLVDELLVLARLDESADSEREGPIQVDQVLTEVADSFSATVAQSGGKLVSSLSPARVDGDDRQLARLFSNLLDNALRHGPRGGTIRLTLGIQGGRVVAVVQDEGGNIPAASIPRLFERFFRVDGSRASSAGGAGLGLAIAHDIVVRLGGTIEVTSHPASGTRVIVTLPPAQATKKT